MARERPTVIKLGNNSKLRSEKQTFPEMAPVNSFPTNSSRELCNHTWNGKNASMIGNLDDEMKNDFKWLVQFKLNSLYLHDIDAADGHTNTFVIVGRTLIDRRLTFTEELQNNGKKFSPSMKPATCFPRKNVPFSYTEMIENCLCEVGEATVKFIYKWIAERFPCFSPHDMTWKNAVRHNLTVNPKFKKKKTRNGRCHLWCICNTEEDVVVYESFIPVNQRSGYSIKEPNCEKIPPAIPIKKFIPVKFSTNPVFASQDVWYTTTKDIAETTTDFKQTSAYCELQTPMATEFLTDGNDYTEPLEVKCLLDENAASIPVELI